MTEKLLFLFFALIIIITAVGCDKHKVAGKVVFPDGSPVTRGVISFINQDKNIIGGGRIKPDGTFTAGVKTEVDGLPKGNYVVTIETSSPESDGGPVAFVSITDTKYASSSRSGLTATVPSSQYNFTVEPPAN